MNKTIQNRVRFAPSPTGQLHIGGLRTALYNYYFAKKTKSKFIIRIEDTDVARLVPGAMEEILNILKIFGVQYDEGPDVGGEFGPYIQSKRLNLYKNAAETLITSGNAYYCFCSQKRLEKLRQNQEFENKQIKYDRFCLNSEVQKDAKRRIELGEPYVIRLKIPSTGTLEFNDIIRGNIKFPISNMDDQIILKSDGFPTYHLASVVDDHEMRITHVIRGEEWISSTPKHLLLYSAFGWEAPQFAHLSNILNENHSKLSKRHGDVSVESFLEKGYLEKAIINFVSLLGFNPKSDREIYTIEEYAELFDLSKVNKSGAIFDREKLLWMNHHYIANLTTEEFVQKSAPFLIKNGFEPSFLKEDKFWIETWTRLEKERINLMNQVGFETSFVFLKPDYSATLLIWKNIPRSSVKNNLNMIRQWLMDENSADIFHSPKRIEEFIKNKISENNIERGEVLWPFRVAITGKEKSPPPFECAYLLGKEDTLFRINVAIDKLNY